MSLPFCGRKRGVLFSRHGWICRNGSFSHSWLCGVGICGGGAALSDEPGWCWPVPTGNSKVLCGCNGWRSSRRRWLTSYQPPSWLQKVYNPAEVERTYARLVGPRARQARTKNRRKVSQAPVRDCHKNGSQIGNRKSLKSCRERGAPRGLVAKFGQIAREFEFRCSTDACRIEPRSKIVLR